MNGWDLSLNPKKKPKSFETPLFKELWEKASKESEVLSDYGRREYVPPTKRGHGFTTTVRYSGDRKRAQILEGTQLKRQLEIFRHFNGFQKLVQNQVRIDFFVEGEREGYIFMKTLDGREDVVIWAKPRESEKKEQKYTRSKVCPVLMGYDATAEKIAGYFVFLDGFFSENTLFLPLETDPNIRGPWPVLDVKGKRPISSLIFHSSYTPSSLSARHYTAEPDYEGEYPPNVLFKTTEEGHESLEGAVQGSYAGLGPTNESYRWENLPMYSLGGYYGSGVLSSVWEDGSWCGMVEYSSRDGNGTPVIFETQFAFHSPGASWSKVLVPAWEYPEEEDDILYGITANPREWGLAGMDYKRGGRLYAAFGGKALKNAPGFSPTEHRVLLVSPSYGEDVQWLLADELRAMASVDYDGLKLAPYVPQALLPHDWCLVTEEV